MGEGEENEKEKEDEDLISKYRYKPHFEHLLPVVRRSFYFLTIFIRID